MRQGEERRVEEGFARLVGQRQALEVEHLATRTFEHALSGRGVPLRGRRKARVAIGIAFGQQAELQRAANIGHVQITKLLAQAGEQTLLRGAGMALAGYHGEGFAGGDTHTDRLRLGPCLTAPGPQTRATKITTPTGRNADHAEYHPPLLNQRDVNGKFLGACDKFLSAIQRIDQPPARPLRPRAERNVGSLFREHRNLRRQRVQAGQQQIMGRQVSGGYRRAVLFSGHCGIAAPKR